MPDAMFESLVNRLSNTRYASVSEYIRDLIRKDETVRGKPEQTPAPIEEPQAERSPFIIRAANEIMRDVIASKKGRA